MDRNITFSVRTNGDESKVEQTFTLEELNLESNLNEEDMEKKVHELFKIWVWNQLSYSVVIDHPHSAADE